MELALATNQWIWLTNTLEQFNVLDTNASIFCDIKATIDIAYDDKVGDRFKHINIAYQLVCENVKYGRISLIQVESAQNLAMICTTRRLEITFVKLRTAIMDSK
jgi:hypothetical protein